MQGDDRYEVQTEYERFEEDGVPTQSGRWLRWLGAALVWSALAIALQVALGAA